MTAVTPLPLDAIADPELRDLIAEGEALGVPDALFSRILARAPAQGKPLLRALIMSHRDGSVDHRLKEIIRVQLARFAGDPYFSGLRSRKAREAGLTEAAIDAGSGDYEDEPSFTEAEKCALRYADQMYLDPSKVNAAFYAELKTHFTEAQIMELGSFIALHYGMQMFMRSLRAALPRDVA
ncbi:MAG: carboxymuconolactone decarboxylase family protein [Xanthobacteraceae bacterium]